MTSPTPVVRWGLCHWLRCHQHHLCRHLGEGLDHRLWYRQHPSYANILVRGFFINFGSSILSTPKFRWGASPSTSRTLTFWLEGLTIYFGIFDFTVAINLEGVITHIGIFDFIFAINMERGLSTTSMKTSMPTPSTSSIRKISKSGYREEHWKINRL